MAFAPHLDGFIDIIAEALVREIEAEEAAALRQRAAATQEMTKTVNRYALRRGTRKLLDGDLMILTEQGDR